MSSTWGQMRRRVSSRSGRMLAPHILRENRVVVERGRAAGGEVLGNPPLLLRLLPLALPHEFCVAVQRVVSQRHAILLVGEALEKLVRGALREVELPGLIALVLPAHGGEVLVLPEKLVPDGVREDSLHVLLCHAVVAEEPREGLRVSRKSLPFGARGEPVPRPMAEVVLPVAVRRAFLVGALLAVLLARRELGFDEVQEERGAHLRVSLADERDAGNLRPCLDALLGAKKLQVALQHSAEFLSEVDR